MNNGCCPSQAPSEAAELLSELLSHQLFKALGDPNRIRLLLLLIERCRTCTVSELADCLTVDQSVVSRHLAMLRAAGVLHAEREGKHVRYSIQYQHLVEMLRAIADAIESAAPATQPQPETTPIQLTTPNTQRKTSQ